MVNKESKEKFFLFNIVKPNSGLKKNEMTFISKISYSIVGILLIIDIVVIIFFLKTNKRLNALSKHEYTQDIYKNLRESRHEQEEYSQRSKKIMIEKQTHLESLVKRLNFDQVNARKLNTGKVELTTIDKLSELIYRFYADKYKDPQILQEAVLAYEDTEGELIRLNNYLMPLTELDRYNRQVESYLDDMLKEINNNQQTFLNQIKHLSSTHRAQQQLLMDDVLASLKDFNGYYKSMVKGNKFKRINNFYQVKFMDFDQDYVPYSTDFSPGKFGAQLTEKVDFGLRLPRIYICNLRAIIRSDSSFEINFEYIDIINDNHTIVAITEPLMGKYKESFVYNNYLIFVLSEGNHQLYLRTTSRGTASEIRISKMSLECISYRNFDIKQDISMRF